MTRAAAPSPRSDDAPRGLLDLLTGPVSARSVLAQVLTGLVVGGLVFGSAAAAASLAGGVDTGGDERRTAVFLTGGSVDRRQTQAAAEALGWDITALITPRAGIGSPAGGEPVALAKQVKTQKELLEADVVVVQGGEADTRMTQEALSVASAHLIDYLQAFAQEGSSIVLAGPIPGSDQTPAQLVGPNTVLRDRAAKEGVPYLDALEAGLSRTSTELGKEFARELVTLVPSGG